jgi:cytochrome c-type biogenesis protein CcmH
MTRGLRPLAATAVLALVLLGAVTIWAWASGRPASVEQQAHEIALRLRCPSCQGASVADSPSPVAQDIRHKILADLHAGRSANDITNDFVRVYGDWILLSPPREGVGLVPWVVSLLGTAAGAVAWLVTVLHWRQRSSAARDLQEDE